MQILLGLQHRVIVVLRSSGIMKRSYTLNLERNAIDRSFNPRHHKFTGAL